MLILPLNKLRGRRTGALVLRIELIAEGSSRRVETHRQMTWLLALDKFKKVLRETEQDGSVCPLGIYHWPAQEGIVHLKYQGVAVYEKKFHDYFNSSTNMKLFKRKCNSASISIL